MSARAPRVQLHPIVGVLGIAAEHGLSAVIADTTPDNLASQRSLVRAGFRLVGSDDGLQYYEAVLRDGHRPA